MILFLIILLLLGLFVWSLFEKPAVVNGYLNTNTDELLLTLNWYGSFFKAEINIIKYSPRLSIFIFQKRIYSKAVKKRKGKRKMNLEDIRALVLYDEYATVRYGLDNPFSTGIACGLMEIIQTYFSGIRITQVPDFIPFQEYVEMDAGAKLNIGKTVVNILRLQSERKGEKENGSIQLDRKRGRFVS